MININEIQIVLRRMAQLIREGGALMGRLHSRNLQTKSPMILALYWQKSYLHLGELGRLTVKTRLAIYSIGFI